MKDNRVTYICRVCNMACITTKDSEEATTRICRECK
jgi:peptide subunit release factor 1 (eRF1)